MEYSDYQLLKVDGGNRVYIRVLIRMSELVVVIDCVVLWPTLRCRKQAVTEL